VIDNNNGETWPIAVIGDEDVHTQAGIVRARHFMRLPRRAGDTRRIDMWLAPSLGWLPARLMQTEPNGAQIELVWHGPLAPPLHRLRRPRPLPLHRLTARRRTQRTRLPGIGICRAGNRAGWLYATAIEQPSAQRRCPRHGGRDARLRAARTMRRHRSAISTD
jgi:hypothetical protein